MRIIRHQRTRKKVIGTKIRPRLSVFRSLSHIYAQINKDDNSPSNFALVRIKENSYTITQKSPNLYNIALTLIEQV